jgi:glycine/D-amino acid oxidase-like deaminating enzyme
MKENTDVVVIGGGYAGVMAANRLMQRDDVTVTRINPRPTFVERIRLHQMAGGSNDAVVDYKEILSDGIRLVVDTVTRIDASDRSVTLGTGGTVGYDYLVYAVGSRSADLGVPGSAEFAYPIATLEAAERLRSVLDQTVRYALDDGYDVILDGILNTRHYGDMLRGLSVDHPGATGHYYFEISLEETLRRHTARPLAKEVSPDQLLAWYHHRDLLPFVKECIIDHTASLEQTVERVMRELDWWCGQAVPHSLDQLA